MKPALSVVFLFSLVFSYAQNNTDTWLVEPFKNLGFTENLGRYETVMDEEAQFFAEVQGSKIFFSNDAFIFGKPEEFSEEELHERHEKMEHGEGVKPIEWNYFKIEFLNSNPTASLSGVDQKKHTRNFRNPENKTQVIKAGAYGVLKYENLYENIDMVLELPDEGGLKYSFYVHPGGDPSQIALSYDGVSVEKKQSGSLLIENAFFSVVDEKPVSLVDGVEIKSEFIEGENIVRFQIDPYNPEKELIIDPWLVSDFPSGELEKIIEVSADSVGNCIAVYSIIETLRAELLFYNPAGELQWSLATDIFGIAPDIAMNPSTGTTYLIAGYGPITIWKVNKLGGIDATLAMPPIGEESCYEAWRIEYNSTNHKVYTGDGGAAGMHCSDITVYDSSLIAYERFEPFNDDESLVEDCALFEVDPYDGMLYSVPAQEVSGINPKPYGNKLFKLDMDDPNTVLWGAETAHDFVEFGNATFQSMNGVNGLACGRNFVYTYNGREVNRFDKVTGEVLDTLTILSGFFLHTEYGLAIDDCDNLYVGGVDTILVFNEVLEPLEGYTLPGACYDLVFLNGYLSASGYNFVFRTEMEAYIPPSSTFTFCESCIGTATVNPITRCARTLESIVWSPSGATGETATDLCEGWHVATITWIGEDGEEFIEIDSVEVINDGGGFEVEAVVFNESCPGSCNGGVTFIPTSGVPPYNYELGIETNETGEFTGLCVGSYDLTVTDATLCSYHTTITIESGDDIGLSIGNTNNPSCFGYDDGSITVTTFEGLGDVDYDWTPENEIGGATFNNIEGGTYTVIAVSEDGCTDTLEVTIYSPDSLYADFDVSNAICFGDSTGTVDVETVYNAQGYLGNLSFFWTPNYFGSNGAGVDSASGMPPGDYSLTINDDFGCSKTYDFSITSPPELIFSELDFEPAFCRLSSAQNGNGVVYAAATGGVSDYDYNWEYLDGNGSSNNSTWGGRNPGTYRITVTDENGCTLIETVELDSVNPVAAFTVDSDQLDENCEGTELVIANFINESEFFADPNDPSADTTFFWNLDHPSAGWEISHSYFEAFDSSYVGEAIYQVCLVAINKNGCKDTTCKDLIVHVQPEFITPNVFSPGGDGLNDFFTFEFRTLGIETFYCQIVNRWGVPVAELNNISEGWDGRDFNGDFCNDGTYFFTYGAIATNGTAFNGQGTVQLVRD